MDITFCCSVASLRYVCRAVYGVRGTQQEVGLAFCMAFIDTALAYTGIIQMLTRPMKLSASF